ncbi:MAG TPA: multicopper oxidase domain-containing protein, partial [Thermoanaerobaculia bacterium]|nr:multicopper oxidase domain-containing protein [Thermoanaerobaculia bacterium]
AVGCWEYGLYALVFAGADVTVDGTGLLAHAALDGALLWPLVALALGLGLVVARRRGSGLSGALVAATAASLAFFALTVGFDGLRQGTHEAVGQSTGIAVAETVVTSSEAEDGAAATQLCSVASLRDKGAARLRALTGVAPTPSLGERLEAGLASAATGQLAFLPLMLAFFAWRRRGDVAALVARARGLGGARRAPWLSPMRLLIVATAALFVVALVMPDGFSAVQQAQPKLLVSNPCTSGGTVRTYDVSAIHVEMTLNRFGDSDPDAYMYVLDSDIPAVRAQEQAALPDRVSIGLRKDPIQPLVIRAAMGECLRIRFTNRLNSGRASFHPMGLPYTAANGAGHVGDNPNTAAPPGQTRTYEIPIPTDAQAERGYYVHDHGASRQRVVHGLFGAVIVEPADATWLDPESGELRSDEQWSNWEAIIVDPNGDSFREFVIMYHEVGDEQFQGLEAAQSSELPNDFVEMPTVDGGNLPQLDEIGIYRPGGRALNYRSEPFRNRLLMGEEQTGVIDESQGYGSYMFGDPATPIPRSYLGEPTKTRLMHGGTEVFHVHHLHGGGDRWRRNPDGDANNTFSGGIDKSPEAPYSSHLDSQSIGPGTSYNLEHECGAGGCQQVAGDFLWHCHIGHHYLAGMWSFWRVFDTDQTADPDHPLAKVPVLFDPYPAVEQPPEAVVSYELLGQVIGGKTVVLLANFTNPATEIPLEPWIENQLPPPGAPLDDQDATVWDWTVQATANGPLYLGEPEDARKWPDFVAANPGVRPPILFNPNNGRYAWPLLRPHLAQRPPFSGNGHTGTPWLGFEESAERPDALCPSGQRVLHYPLSAVNVSLPVTPTENDLNGKIFVLNENKPLLGNDDFRQPLAIRMNTYDCAELLLTNEIPASLTPFDHSKVNLHTHFIQFDPQASDGVITGLSFEQSVLPYEEENRDLTSSVSAGATTIP